MNENKSTNFNQALWLGMSGFSSMALAFVSAAILSRYFDKEEYGTYKQILYVYAALNVVFTAGLPGVFSYFLPRLSSGQGKTLVYRVSLLFFLFGGLFSLLLFFGADALADLLKNPDLAVGLRLFAPFPLFTLSALGVEGIYTALRKTKFIAIYQTVNKLLMLICIVSPVILFHGDFKSAIIGWGVASFVTWLIALYMKRKPFTDVEAEVVPRLYKTVFDYSLPLMCASLVGMFLHSANQFFISRYFGREAFADFSNGFTPLPFVGMIAGSIKAVLLPVFSKASSENNLDSALPAYNNAVIQSVLILYPLLLFCMVFSKDFVVLVYGEQYAASSIYFKISLFKSFVEVFPFLAILLALGKSSVYLYVHVAAAILIWTIDFTLIKLFPNPVAIAFAYSIITILTTCSFLAYLIIVKKVRLLQAQVFKKVVLIAGHVLCALFVVSFVSKILPHDLIGLYRLIISGILFYLLIIGTAKLIGVDYLSSLKMLFKRKD